MRPASPGLLPRLLKFTFRRLYNEFAWIYDAVAAIVSVGQWGDWVRSVLPRLEGPAVLELGFGTGHLQVALLRGNLKAFGLDASRSMGRLARRRALEAGLSPSLVAADARAIPFPDATFNQVVATFPAEYIAEAETLGEIWRVLVPGGRLVVLPIAWLHGRRPAERLAAWLFRVTRQAPASLSPAGGAAWEAQLLSPLRRAGFRAHLERESRGAATLIHLIAEKPPEG